MTTTFKVGDRVRVVAVVGETDAAIESRIGQTATVTKIDAPPTPYPIVVKYDSDDERGDCWPTELELVTPELVQQTAQTITPRSVPAAWRVGNIAGLTDQFAGPTAGETVVAFVLDDWSLAELETLAETAGHSLSVYVRAVVLEHVGATLLAGASS